jgi:hypothetical protein
MQIELVSTRTSASAETMHSASYSPHLAARREGGEIRKQIRTDVDYRLTFAYAHEP